MQLLITGNKSFKSENFYESLRLFKFKDEVKIYQDISSMDKQKIMSSAYAIINPATYLSAEQIIYPALKSQVPVIVNDAEIFTKTFADAVLYANMNNHKILAEQMMLLFKNENFRNELIEKGKRFAADFSVNKTINELSNAVLKTVL